MIFIIYNHPGYCGEFRKLDKTFANYYSIRVFIVIKL